MTRRETSAVSRLDTWLDHILVWMLVVISGHPSVYGNRLVLIAVAAVLLALLVKREKYVPTFRSQVVLLVFLAVLSIQSISMNTFHAITMAGFASRLFVAYATVRAVRDFPATYVAVLFWIGLVSWPFYLANILTGGMLAQWCAPVGRIVGVEGVTHIVIHGFRPDVFRNASWFWEPGAFSACLLLAIMLLGIMRQRWSPRRYRIMLAVLSLTVVSTLSTAGMVLLPLCLWIVSCGGAVNSAREALAWVGGLVLVVGCYAALCNVTYVGVKVRSQYEAALERRSGWEINRFGTLLSDLEYIRSRPLFGWGAHSETRYLLHGGRTVEGQGNGLSDFTAKYGLLGIGTYLVCAWVGAYKLANHDKLKSWMFVLFVALVLNGEALLNHPLYLGVMFLEPVQGSRRA